MPPIPETATDLPLDSLSTHLAEILPRFDGPLQADLLSGGRSNPTYALTEGTNEWILRRPPYGAVWKSAHDIGREARVLQALAGTAVPVPAVVDHCRDESVIGAPFYVMPRIAGRTLRDRSDTEALTPQQRRGLAESLVSTLVALHEIDPSEIGLGDFGRPDGYLERQLRRWDQQWDSLRTPDRVDASELQHALAAAMPTSTLTGIVHGDYKLDNVLVSTEDPTRIVAVLDWEMATLGDTLADVGFLLSFWDEIGGPHNPLTAGATALEGFPSAHEMATMYAEQRDIDVNDLSWYVAFSNYKLAVILQQIHVRHLRGETRGEGFEELGPMINPLIELALDRLEEHR